MALGFVNELLPLSTCILPSTVVQPFTLKEIVITSPRAAVIVFVVKYPIELPPPSFTVPPAG